MAETLVPPKASVEQRRHTLGTDSAALPTAASHAMVKLDDRCNSDSVAAFGIWLAVQGLVKVGASAAGSLRGQSAVKGGRPHSVQLALNS